jgi:hypothetical protein
MVGRHYLLETRSRPGGLKIYVDQRLIPAAIDIAGGVESAAERVAVRVRRLPLLMVGAAFGFGLIAAQVRLRGRSR